MTVVRIAVHAAIRTAAIALGLLAYDRLYDLVLPGTSGDADIGKGLLAFLLIASGCLAWGLLDGFLVAPLVWLVAWPVAALALSLGWEVLLEDGSWALVNIGSVIFIAQLILVPALVGAGFTWLVAGRHSSPTATSVA